MGYSEYPMGITDSPRVPPSTHGYGRGWATAQGPYSDVATDDVDASSLLFVVESPRLPRHPILSLR